MSRNAKSENYTTVHKTQVHKDNFVINFEFQSLLTNFIITLSVLITDHMIAVIVVYQLIFDYQKRVYWKRDYLGETQIF